MHLVECNFIILHKLFNFILAIRILLVRQTMIIITPLVQERLLRHLQPRLQSTIVTAVILMPI